MYDHYVYIIYVFVKFLDEPLVMICLIELPPRARSLPENSSSSLERKHLRETNREGSYCSGRVASAVLSLLQWHWIWMSCLTDQPSRQATWVNLGFVLRHCRRSCSTLSKCSYWAKGRGQRHIKKWALCTSLVHLQLVWDRDGAIYKSRTPVTTAHFRLWHCCRHLCKQVALLASNLTPITQLRSYPTV